MEPKIRPDDEGHSDELKHTYPSLYPPGTYWAVDEAWRILDELKPGVLSPDVRAYLAGAIAGLLMKERGECENGERNDLSGS